jgi:hypothetical protein
MRKLYGLLPCVMNRHFKAKNAREVLMQRVLIAGITLFVLTQLAQACAPAPSCYMTESKDYLKTVCLQDAKRVIEPTMYDDPDSIPAYIKACKKLGFTVKTK